jgi:glutamate-5-semialdehyde dehydrogenase
MTGAGVCHLYVSSTATPDMAVSIALNAKTQRPGVCNAIETLLIHKDYPTPFNLLKTLMSAGVHLKVCPKTLAQLESELNLSEISEVIKSKFDTLFSLADENDFAEEYLALTLAVKQVNSTQEALAHIQKYSTGHSEAIVTQDIEEAELFLNRVDSACVYHNASTRFTDGGCFGFGCEIGIATQKLHARGPMGLKEITSYKYQIRGNGQTRN